MNEDDIYLLFFIGGFLFAGLMITFLIFWKSIEESLFPFIAGIIVASVFWYFVGG